MFFENKFFQKLEFNQDDSNLFIFIANIDNYLSNILKFWQCLSELEKIQASKYYTFKLTKRYIIAHGILRYILGYYIKQNPRDIKFIINKYGKPFIENNKIQFNMSHSHNLIGYVVSLNYKVGIDIELHSTNINIWELSHLVFTPTEHNFFSTVANNKKLKYFYDLWTKKESLIKAMWLGLTYPII
ncbi:4'-phosphopantetheinyl transferase family protein [Orientia tsutsugamushi]|uniref:4'-phosphopantetheinyl transferase family protein n=1 Tax=Orientia tsutsugamushi TaxID=784 RepID=UPI000D5A65FD|nr:4'-phosphopantetheinyl transferase sfp [Orientia tsutsugamushi]